MQADKQGEILSALMDGETTELEVRQLLVALDDEQAERWARWHLVKDVLQGHASHVQVDASFRANIRAAIAQHPVNERHWLKSFSRVAVAASVALAVVAGWQLKQQSNSPELTQAPVVASVSHLLQAPVPVADAFYPATGQATTAAYGRPESVTVQPVADTITVNRTEFNRLLERHSDDATTSGSQGMMPYVRLIDFDARDNQ